MKYYLLTYNDNWAREVDLSGYWAFTEEDLDYEPIFDALKFITNKIANGTKFVFVINLGSESWIDYEDVIRFTKAYDIKEITQHQYEALASLKLLYSDFGLEFTDQVLTYYYDHRED
jgi:hypothetical protein